MRVGLNASYLVPNQVGGVEIFARELVDALTRSASDIQLVVFTSRDARDVFLPVQDKCQVVVCSFSARNRVARYFWEQFVLPWQTIAYRLDVLHSLSYVGPILCPIPTILTIHDANSRRRAVTMSRSRRTMLSLVSGLAAKCSDIVATVSEFSRNELTRWYNLPKERIEVIPSGPGAKLLPQPPRFTTCELERYASTGPYLLAMGGGWAHKNMPRLIQAFQKIADEVPHRLIISGTIFGASTPFAPDSKIICTGYLQRSDLQELLRRSELFVMPSIYEGFGFPVLEAQALGVAVACSNVASLPELVLDSAGTFDPENIDDMARVIKSCLLDHARRQSMKSLAEENIQRFSWESTARRYEALYLGLGQQPRRRIAHTWSCFVRALRPS